MHPKLYALAFLACHDAGWQHQPLKQVTPCTSCTSSDSPYFPWWQVPAAVHWALQDGHGRGSQDGSSSSPVNGILELCLRLWPFQLHGGGQQVVLNAECFLNQRHSCHLHSATISLCHKGPRSIMRQKCILLASAVRLVSCQLSLAWSCLINLLKALQPGGPAFLKHAV